MRVLFVGDAISGRLILEEIKKVGVLVALAIADRDRTKLTNFGTPIIDINTINQMSKIDEIKTWNIDLLVNFNSSIIFSKELLACFTIGGINFHPGILPQYAGSNTHQWAMLNNELYSGVTIHVINQGVDAGPVLSFSKVKILVADTGFTLFIKLVQLGSELIAQLLPKILKQGFDFATPQDFSKRNFFLKNKRIDGKISFNQKASCVQRFIQALNYRPVISPLGHSFIEAPLCIIEPIRVSVSTGSLAPPSMPGTILKIDSECMSIACMDKSIQIKKFWFQNKLIDAVEGAAVSGMRIGHVI